MDSESIELTLELTAMAHGGTALGRDEDGRVVFVPGGIPGEKVRVRPVLVKERHAYAELLEVIERSPYRVEPHCPHYGVCGGCHFQHIDYPAQLQFKTEVVRDQLGRVGHFIDPPVEPALPSPVQWRYRNSVNFSPTADGKLGFWSPTEEQVVPIDECHIIEAGLQTLYREMDLELPGLLRVTLRIGADGDLLVVFETEDVEPPELATDLTVSAAILLPTGEAANLIGENVLYERCAGREWRVSAGSFFQVNRASAENLVRLVLEMANLHGTESVLELYSGVGLFTASLSAGSSGVVGIEENPDAVGDAALNLDDTENVSLYQGAVEQILPELSDRSFDVVVLDPPRGGVEPAVVDALIEIGAPRIVYVSCDPATFARDAKRLARGGYRLMTVRPVDMFPQTYHVETVSLLSME
ncbi:MAG: class I SAM-dependent RNA methyltransferase [Anaerolineales bacterium]|nr:class I SAM-dependent RNA methyltransferase [Anaerolineales bacterium]